MCKLPEATPCCDSFPSNDFEAKSEIHKQTAEHVMLNVLHEDKCENGY